MYALTGASGQLGRLTITNLLTKVPASQIIATTRNPEKLADFAAQGVIVRPADLNNPASLETAFEGGYPTTNYQHIRIWETDRPEPGRD